MKETAGLFLVRKDGMILGCHPTNHKKDFFSISKGGIDKGETPLEAAIRETYEEANVDASNFVVIHTLTRKVHKNNKKALQPFVLFEKENKLDFSKFDLKCNSKVPEEIGGFPEMDGYKWFTIDEVREHFFHAQVECLDEIIKLNNI